MLALPWSVTNDIASVVTTTVRLVGLDEGVNSLRRGYYDTLNPT